MLCCTIGDIERAIYDLEQYFGVSYDGLTNGECVEKLRGLCERLHSNEELVVLSEKLLDILFDEFGWTGLRVWYDLSVGGMFANSMMAMKYDKLYSDICHRVEEFRVENGLDLILDVQLFGVEVKKLFKDRYGWIDENLVNDLYSILNTINLTRYDDNLIKELHYLVKLMLIGVGDKYYYKKDLTDKEVLEELYTHIAEIMCDNRVYKGHDLFYDYDGYGGSYCTVTEKVGE